MKLISPTYGKSKLKTVSLTEELHLNGRLQAEGVKLPKTADDLSMRNRRATMNMVYKIPCKVYLKSYIGQSKRETGTRLKERESSVVHCRTEKCDLANHYWTQQHHINYGNTWVIDNDKNWKGKN